MLIIFIKYYAIDKIMPTGVINGTFKKDSAFFLQSKSIARPSNELSKNYL